MTRLIAFADGFESASAPSLSGGTQENYTILNNQAAPITLFTIDGAVNKSAFVDFELSRSDVSDSYLQAGSLILSYNGTTWELQFGAYQGDAIIEESLLAVFNVVLSVSAGGVLSYTSGNMGASYLGKLKMIITRVSIL